LTDAEDPLQEMFGEQRLLAVIQRYAPLGSRAVEEGILRALEEFTDGTPQTDDITLLIVEKNV
jgi:serine phosphatase RsbU (regulator of sigma subunit)